jgi:hypothetical protein
MPRAAHSWCAIYGERLVGAVAINRPFGLDGVRQALSAVPCGPAR